VTNAQQLGLQQFPQFGLVGRQRSSSALVLKVLIYTRYDMVMTVKSQWCTVSAGASLKERMNE